MLLVPHVVDEQILFLMVIFNELYSIHLQKGIEDKHSLDKGDRKEITEDKYR